MSDVTGTSSAILHADARQIRGASPLLNGQRLHQAERELSETDSVRADHRQRRIFGEWVVSEERGVGTGEY